MLVFDQHFVNSTLTQLDQATVNGRSVTRDALCALLQIDPVFSGVFSVLLLMPDFSGFESVRGRYGGIRRRKASGPADPASSQPDAVSGSLPPEPATEPESASQLELEPVIDMEQQCQLANAEPVKPVLKIIGINGNAFALMAAASKVARHNGLDWDSILGELTSGDYDNLLATLCKHFDVQ